jgi:hypothetical protein
LADKQDPHETARARLRPLIESFDAKVDYAVAYGSGVIHQANRPTSNDVGPELTLLYDTINDLIVRSAYRFDYLGTLSYGVSSYESTPESDSLPISGALGWWEWDCLVTGELGREGLVRYHGQDKGSSTFRPSFTP